MSCEHRASHSLAGSGEGVVAGYGVALPVGPIATYLISLGVRDRFPVAAAAALGVASTDGVFAAVAVAGGIGLKRLLDPASAALTYVSAAVLLALAVRTAVTALHNYRQTAAPGTLRATARDPRRAYLGLVGLTALNPTTISYFAALVVGGQARHTGSAVAFGVPFSIGAFLASASWQLFLAASGAMLGTMLTGRRAQLGVAALSGAIMLALAARIVIQ